MSNSKLYLFWLRFWCLAPFLLRGLTWGNCAHGPKTTLMFLCQSGIWPILCQLMAIFAFTLTLMYKPILKSIRPKLAILSPKILQKVTKMAVSQNPILPKCHSPKSLLLPHFSMNLSETFRINVYIIEADFLI